MVRPGLASHLRRSLLALCLLLVAQVPHAAAGSVRLAWDANIEPDLAGYMLVWGTAPGTYSQSVTVPASTVTQDVAGLADGTYYFAVRAFNLAGLYSGYSNEVVVTVTTPRSTPAVTAVTPSNGPSSGGTQVVVSGSGFLTGATVAFGGTAATVVGQTSTSITVLTPAASAATVALSVTNPDGGVATRASAFTYVSPNGPTVTSFAPAIGPTSGGTDVVITGTNFQNGVVVRFGALPAVVSSVTTTRLVARTPAQARGVVAISVVNPDGNGVQVPSAFSYRGPAPRVTTVLPKTGTTTGGTDVQIDGADFEPGVTVSVDALPATVLTVTPNRLVVRMPAHAPAAVGFTVTNPDAQLAWVPAVYTYVSVAPSISAVAPTHGPTDGGTSVTISGSAFAAGAAVLFDGVAAVVTSLASDTLVVTSPAHASGAVSVLVRNADGQSATAVNGYTYDDTTPVISTVTPAKGSVDGGTVITITGLRFGTQPTVSLDGRAARILSASDTVVTAETPAHAAGPVGVAVVTARGESTVAPSGFTYEDPARDTTFTRYFAEGAAGAFFQTRFALANPHEEAVPVTVTFTDTQGVATPLQVTLPARSRLTIDERNRPALASEAFATAFEAPKVIGVERTMTWAAGGPAYGAHSEIGVAAPRTSWVLAEGATIAGFNTFYLLQNPTTTAADVKVQYLLSTGQRIEKIHPVAPLSRTNIWVNKDDPALDAAEMSASITSLNNVPVVVERSMYRNNGSELFSAGHNSAAVEAPALRWFLAEGATGGTFDEFVLIANPNTAPAQLRVSYLRAGKAPIVKSYSAPALSRLTLWVDQEHAELANAEVSIVVESLTATPVVVERSMWWRADAAGEWVEAHNSRGTTTTAPRWLVADGEAGGVGQASTYVLVANTSAAATGVRFTLLTETGVGRTVQDTVTANGRYSLDVASTFPEAAGTRFSVLVESATGTAPLVVERASYSSTATTTWAAGTNAVAMPLP
ncbi:IPT/TIG domain-containing protein [Luteitalea sp.]|jgi:hypothetical protein|uniref:IPT/TIG domain-containing protein n=1 Tax=Luteitalea sp. TaxID=2004800 RepID=UPI0037C77F50